MTVDDVKMMALRRDGECVCGTFVPKGTQAGWHRTLRIVLCARCLRVEPQEVPVDIGVPGASLDREYVRRKQSYERRVRARHPHLGGLMLRFSAPKATTEAFRIGAAGEREVAAALSEAVGEEVLFLYNRRRGTGRVLGDIDMIAIAPSGVHIIDPKKYRGRKVRANRAQDTFIIDGRRHPALSASMLKQIEAVTAAVNSGPRPTTPVHAAYCFVGADLPWRALAVNGVPAVGMRGVARLLSQPGTLDRESREILHRDLSVRLPPA